MAGASSSGGKENGDPDAQAYRELASDETGQIRDRLYQYTCGDGNILSINQMTACTE